MKTPVWLKTSTRRDKIVFTAIGLFVLALFIQSAATLGLIRPLSLDDFVVDSNDNIVVVSGFHQRIFYISKSGCLVDTIRIPEGGGGITMAIDASDNVYINRRRCVEVYSRKNEPKYTSVALDKTDDWFLGKGYKVSNLNKTMSYEYSHCTAGSRKPVSFGNFLFHDIKCDNSLGRSFEFRTATKEYEISSFWNDEVSVSDHQGHFLYKVTITPFYMKFFAFPIPFAGILLIFAVAYWVAGKLTVLNK